MILMMLWQETILEKHFRHPFFFFLWTLVHYTTIIRQPQYGRWLESKPLWYWKNKNLLFFLSAWVVMFNLKAHPSLCFIKVIFVKLPSYRSFYYLWNRNRELVSPKVHFLIKKKPSLTMALTWNPHGSMREKGNGKVKKQKKRFSFTSNAAKKQHW